MSFKESIVDFIKAGNEVVGDLPVLKGRCTFEWKGTGSSITFGDGILLTSTRIKMGEHSTIKLRAKCRIKGSLWADDNSKIFVGRRTVFNRSCVVTASEGTKIVIRSNCLFSDVKIRTSDLHSIFDLETGDRLNPARDIVINDSVWLSEEVFVYKGTTIGEGSIVGARSIVTKDIAPHSLAVGAPARVIRSNVCWDRDRTLMTAKKKVD